MNYDIGVIVDNGFDHDIRVTREVDYLCQAGYRVAVLCFGYGEQKEASEFNCAKIFRFRIRPAFKNILMPLINMIPLYEIVWAFKIAQFIRRSGVNAIHAHDLYMARAAHWGRRLAGRMVPMVLDLHENFPHAIQGYNWAVHPVRRLFVRAGRWQNKEKTYLRLADRIIVLSDAYKKQLLESYPDLQADAFAVLPNLPDIKRLSEFSTEPPDSPFSAIPESGRPVILFYFGVVAERRGIFDVFPVFTRLIESGHSVKLLIVGPVDKADRGRFERAISESSIRDHIHHIPWIDISQLPGYLALIDICLAPFIKNPQHESGVANKIFQYMFGGRAIVASDCAPQKQVIEESGCGLVFSNDTEFQTVLTTLIEDPDLRRDMGQKGRRALLEHYNQDESQEQMVELYRALLSD